VADAVAGTFHAYVDGHISSSSEGLDTESLTLRHQLVVLGGGKQAQARGGHVHRLLIHDSALSAEECMKVAGDCKNVLNTHLVWYVAPGTQPGNVKQEIIDAGFSVTMCETVAQALAALKPYTKCFIGTLSDAPIPFVEKDVEQGSATTEETIATLSTLLKMVRAVNSAVVCVADSSCMTSKITYKQGERIAARWRQGTTWYNGRIARVHDNDTYDINYDDGDTESGVLPEYIRSQTLSKVSHAQLLVREKCKSLESSSTVNDTELRDTVFGCEVEFLRRSAAKKN